MNEQWTAIPGYEDLYEVSSLGRVRSVERRVWHTANRWGKGFWKTLPSRLLKQNIRRRYYKVTPSNNRLSNLRWDTKSENVLDQVRNGTHGNARKTHCKRDHEFTPENTYHYLGQRHCRTCRRDANRKAAA